MYNYGWKRSNVLKIPKPLDFSKVKGIPSSWAIIFFVVRTDEFCDL